MASRTVQTLSLAAAGIVTNVVADGPPLTFTNNAKNSVTVVATWPDCSSFQLEPGKSHDWHYSSVKVNKLWIRPQGCPPGQNSKACPEIPVRTDPNFERNCKADCLGCLYVAPNVNKDGQTLDVGLGYGVNTPVQEHDDVGKVSLTYNDVTDHYKERTISCDKKSCPVKDIAVVHYGGKHSVIIDGYQPGPVHDVAADGPPLTFTNKANGIVDVVATWPDCSSFPLNPGQSQDWHYHTLPSAAKVNKLWVRPRECTSADGCPNVPDRQNHPDTYEHDCKADCLGCFYVAPNVAPNQVTLTVGLGYGVNSPPKEHNGVGGIALTYNDATNHNVQTTLSCNKNKCITRDMAVVHAGGLHEVTISDPQGPVPNVVTV